MRKLALDDDILLEIEKPARYIGGEVNAVMKNVEDIDVRFAMCFPIISFVLVFPTLPVIPTTLISRERR